MRIFMTNILLNIKQRIGYPTKITNISDSNLVISGIPVGDNRKVLDIYVIGPKEVVSFDGEMDLKKYYFRFED